MGSALNTVCEAVKAGHIKGGNHQGGDDIGHHPPCHFAQVGRIMGDDDKGGQHGCRESHRVPGEGDARHDQYIIDKDQQKNRSPVIQPVAEQRLARMGMSRAYIEESTQGEDQPAQHGPGGGESFPCEEKVSALPDDIPKAVDVGKDGKKTQDPE